MKRYIVRLYVQDEYGTTVQAESAEAACDIVLEKWSNDGSQLKYLACTDIQAEAEEVVE